MWYCSVSFCVKRATWRKPGGLQIWARHHGAGLGAEVPRRQLHQAVVVDVAGGGDDDAGVHVVRVVVGAHHVRVDARQGLAVADDGPAQRVVAEHRLGEVVVDELGWRVLVHRHLFQHDLALLVEVDEGGPGHHLGDDGEGLVQVFVEEARVDHRVLLGRGRVRLAAHLVEDARDVPCASSGPSP